MIGQKIAHYTITQKIGQGGMGEVYRATDARLKREVALKILPAGLSQDHQRMARFQREAELLASLNHPNIAGIYGLEREGDIQAISMELVDGETLAARIERGALPLEEALQCCLQIARALEAAHGKGIIHRDLKPANVIVTPAGEVKVLDFGLGKALAQAEPPGDPSQSPTLTAQVTQAGIILGTAAYMSPEQARGRTVDVRSDIWAWGCVLFETLTGTPAFKGQAIADVLGAVVGGQPEWEHLPAEVPRSISKLLRRTLEKDNQRRLQHIGDARLELEDALSGTGLEIEESGQRYHRSVWSQTISWAALLLLGGVVLGGLLTWNLKPGSPPEPRPVSRTSVVLPADSQLLAQDTLAFTFSPDGNSLVFVGRNEEKVQHLYARPLNNLQIRRISGTENASNPFFSPDGEWVGFWADGKLKKVAFEGGEPLILCDVGLPLMGATWNANDDIVFATVQLTGLWRVSAAGGTPELVTKPDSAEGETIHLWPSFLPEGNIVVFMGLLAGSNYGEGRILAKNLDTGQRKVLLEAGGAQPSYLSTGHLAFVRQGNLLAVAFDPKEMQVTGVPVSVLGGIMQSASMGTAHYSFSQQGVFAYLPGGMRPENSLVIVDRNGKFNSMLETRRSFESPRFSPDGKRVVVTVRDPNTDIWEVDVARGTLSRLTSNPGEDETPIWSNDGSRIFYASTPDQELRTISWIASDGTGSPQTLVELNQRHVHLGDWSSDGSRLVFVLIADDGLDAIWKFDPGRDTEPSHLFPPGTQSRDAAPTFSPDGNWLAYSSNKTGRFEVFLQPMNSSGRERQVSIEGGTEPVWAKAGQELFYRDGDRMMVVDVALQPSLSLGIPRVLFDEPFVSTPWPLTNYDIAPDGQRFVMVKSSETLETREINIVINWFEQLKHQVP